MGAHGISPQYERNSQRAYVELREADEDGGEVIVTAIFSYHRTSIITKRALEQDLARKARHLMKRERPWLFISGKRVAGLRHRIGLGFLWTQARHHGHVISSINANWPRLSKRGSSL